MNSSSVGSHLSTSGDSGLNSGSVGSHLSTSGDSGLNSSSVGSHLSKSGDSGELVFGHSGLNSLSYYLYIVSVHYW